MHNISDIQHAFYINLISRPDRKEKVEKEMKQLNIPAQRMNAVKVENGRIGCSLSHLKCLMTAKKNEWPHVLIVEDDIHFLNPTTFMFQLNEFLSSRVNWDVILLAGNNIPPYRQEGLYSVQVYHCQTTTGYMVQSHYYDTLIQNIRQGIDLLIKEPENHFHYAIDKYWFQLQEKDRWFLITPLSVIQREDYSDIEEKKTNYSSMMLDLDKSYMTRQVKWQTPIAQNYFMLNKSN